MYLLRVGLGTSYYKRKPRA